MLVIFLSRGWAALAITEPTKESFNIRLQLGHAVISYLPHTRASQANSGGKAAKLLT